MKAIYKKRLLTLAKFLRTVPKKRFKMWTWATGDFCGKKNEPKHNECGTAACAMGWACTIPSFRRAGLKLIDADWSIADNKPQRIPTYEDKIEFEAAEEFFGLPANGRIRGRYVASYLFGGHNKNSPIQAANRIENYIKLEEKGRIEL
jgi:hypothetical protein